ncbi:hypothetical protein MtrunA17_Chr7g0228331 [Medicago truncatula]|uniref:Transmembrane protein n=1 Tax=Medicago truncatula TaxID=3880 RepID=A0A396GVU1_MEDTR|nr:hypothetical protein MtrunA17_Chr7g0228331 [Medicago truncatula]
MYMFNSNYLSLSHLYILMAVVYGHNMLVANNTINMKTEPSTSFVVQGESNPPCLNMKQIIPMNKKVDLEEGAKNSIVQQVPQINYYVSDIMKPTISSFKKQMNVEKGKGRKATNKVIGPISVSFELPRCYLDIDVQRVIATRPRSKDVPRRSTVFDRIKNWTIELRKPADKKRYDIELDSSSNAPNKRMKNCPKIPQVVKKENQMRELSIEEIWKNDMTEDNMSITGLELCEIEDYFDGPDQNPEYF